MVAGMHTAMGERIDALCRRRCAFALYSQPGVSQPVFCMAEDGRVEDSPLFSNGFVLAPFEGECLFIPSELEEPPLPDAWDVLRRLPAQGATTRETYASLFRLYTGFIQSGQVRKIVLARTSDEPVSEQFSPYRAFAAACEAQPMAFKALVHTPRHGTWLFCTPEQLFAGSGQDWQTMALAGTRLPCTLPWDAKNRREQAVVTEFIREVLTPLADEWQEGPLENLRAGHIEHLCTRFYFKMPPGRILRFLDQLHPTPAVCGSPVTTTRQLLRQYPDIDRSCYAGYLGSCGNGEVRFYVSLRCMQIFDDCCRLYAGGGLMPDSVEEQEWQETENKMACMRQAIRGGN